MVVTSALMETEHCRYGLKLRMRMTLGGSGAGLRGERGGYAFPAKTNGRCRIRRTLLEDKLR